MEQECAEKEEKVDRILSSACCVLENKRFKTANRECDPVVFLALNSLTKPGSQQIPPGSLG